MGGARGPHPPRRLFFDQNEARRAEKNFFWKPPPPPPPTPPLSEGLDRRLRCAIQRKTPVIDHPKCK